MTSRRSENANRFTTGLALLIGTGTDATGKMSKRFRTTINDAEFLAQILKEPSLCAYPAGNVKTLLGEDATLERIMEEFDVIEKRVDESDEDFTVVVFFSVHGQREEEKSYLLPYGYKDCEPLEKNAIDGDLLNKKLKAIKSARILLLLNACYSGGVMDKLGSEINRPPLNEKQIKKLSEGKGFAYLCASQEMEQAETGYLANSKSIKRYSVFPLGLARGFCGTKTQVSNDGAVYVSQLATVCVAYVASKTSNRQLPSVDYKGDNFVVGYKHETGALRNFPLLGDDVNFDIDNDCGENEEDKQRVKHSKISYEYSGFNAGKGSTVTIGSGNVFGNQNGNNNVFGHQTNGNNNIFAHQISGNNNFGHQISRYT